MFALRHIGPRRAEIKTMLAKVNCVSLEQMMGQSCPIIYSG